MTAKRNNQHPNTSNQMQTDTTIEPYQYPIIPPIRIGISNQNENPLNNKLRPNSNRNNYNEKNCPRKIGCRSNKPSIQSPINNKPSNLPRLNNLKNPMIQASSRCNQQQSCSDNPLNCNSNKLNQQPLAMEIKEPEYPKFNSPKRKNYNRTDQNHTKNNFTSNKLKSNLYMNAEEDPWDDYTIDKNDIIDKQSCAICLCDFEFEEKAIKLNCGHIFHKSCIIPWYDENIKSPTCPICRKNLLNINFSQISVILREAKSLSADADSLLTEINSYLIEANSFLKQESQNITSRSLQKLKEYEEKIASYMKLIPSYLQRIHFCIDRLKIIETLNLTETEKDSILSLEKSLQKRLDSLLTNLKPIIKEIETFRINAEIMMNSSQSANLSEEKSNLNESNENGSSLFETHQSSRCCILI